MAPLAAALMTGIIAGRYLPIPVGVYAFAGGAALLGAIGALGRKHLLPVATVCVLAMVACLGAAYVQLRYFSVGDDHIVTCTARHRTLATLRGRIVTAPTTWQDDPSVALGWRRPMRTVFILDAEAIRTESTWQPIRGLVRVGIDEGDPRLAAGQRLELVGWIGRFTSPANPGQFDWAAAMRNRGLLVQMSVPTPDGATLLSDAHAPWYRRALWHVRAAARQHLLSFGDAHEGRLINALVLGERHPALRRLNDAMIRAGVAHFLSISGLHLGIFLGFVFLLCRLISLTPRQSAAAVLMVLAAYLLLAEPRPPLLRSAVMAAAMCAATIARRRHAQLNALAVAATALLIADPLRLFDVGFQLSFIIVTSLVCVHRAARRLLFGRFLRRRGLTVFRGEQRLRRWLAYTLTNWLIAGVTISLVAYVAAAPLVARHFGLFCPWAPLLSIVLLPLVAAILITGYVSMAMAWPAPNLSHVVGQLASALAEQLAAIVEWLSRLPAMGLALRPVGGWWVVACYAALALLLVRRRFPCGRIISLAAIVAMIAAAVWTQRPAPPPDVAELNLLAVGAGQCGVLRTPSGQTFLLDAGTQGGYDAANQIIRPFFRAQRLPSPSAAFISHANTDHYNALPALLRLSPVGRVYLNDYFDRADPSDVDQPVAHLMGVLDDHTVQIVRLSAGMTVDLDDRTSIQVLWPTMDLPAETDPNDRSLVLRIACDGRSVLLAGDVQVMAQTALMTADRSAALQSDGLVMPHHGSWRQTLPAFVQAVGPQAVLVSTSRSLTSRGTSARRQEFYDALARSGHVYTTRTDGWIQLRFGAGTFEVRTMRRRP